MLTLDALNVLLTIDEGELIEELFVALLASPQLILFFEKFPRLKQILLRELPRRKAGIEEQLKTTPVPDSISQEIELFRHYQRLPLTVFHQQLADLLQQLGALNSSFCPQAHTLVSHHDSPLPSQAQHILFLQRWRLSLTLATMTLNEQLLDQERDILLTELQQRLATAGRLAPVFSDNNDSAMGRLWDMSATPLQQGDDPLIMQYSDFLARQPELTELASQLGRSRTAQPEPTQLAETEPRITLEREPDNVPEEISGLHQSGDILRLLPAELITLGISELELEFWRRLVEKQLLTYRHTGENWHEKVSPHASSQQHNEIAPRGPFIICVDTSGSMGGFNERCAKAFCLALLKIALMDSRRCYIMLFAHEVVSYELTADDGMAQMVRFLSQRFRGGTDLAACLRAVLQRMDNPLWHEADAVIISDFIAQRLPDTLISAIKQRQKQWHQRFHAVAMSAWGKPGILQIFDKIWRFDTRLQSRLLRHWKQK